MISTTVFYWVIIVLSAVVIFVFLTTRKKKKRKSIYTGIQSFAKIHNSVISLHDHWNEITIGLDENNFRLFYIQNLAERKIEKVIDLAEVNNVKLQKSSHPSAANQSLIANERIYLEFFFYDKQIKNEILEFYNIEYDSLTLRSELQLAEKWCQIVKRFSKTCQEQILNNKNEEDLKNVTELNNGPLYSSTGVK